METQSDNMLDNRILALEKFVFGRGYTAPTTVLEGRDMECLATKGARIIKKLETFTAFELYIDRNVHLGKEKQHLLLHLSQCEEKVNILLLQKYYLLTHMFNQKYY